ncbi:lactase/phlorizin hydrolase-like [Struthio camelus]|uniref:lactase/phlorizin hydrolase-like n=1 Tax=Struthio camelus TaxID=8801 RepID=UPI003603D38C
MELVYKTVFSFFLLASPSFGLDRGLAQNFIAIAGPLPRELVNSLHPQNQVLPKEAQDPGGSEAQEYLCQQDPVPSELPLHLSHLREAGVTHYKIFLPWACILPEGDARRPDEARVRWYRELLETLAAASLRPVVVLHERRVPSTVAARAVRGEAGGFADLFVEYAEFSFRSFGDLVDVWLTFSAVPEVLKSLPYDDHQSRVQALADAHDRAYQVYHEKYSPAAQHPASA